MKSLVAPFRVPDAAIIERLEAVLAEARAGKIMGFVCVTSEADGETGCAWAIGPHAGIMSLVGELEATKLRLMHEFVEGAKP